MERLTPKRPRLSREEQKEQTRRRLIEAAMELFAVKGFEGTGVEELAAHAGYSRGAFYANFRNKTDLMRAIIAEGFDGDLAGIRRLEPLVGTDALADGYNQLAAAFYADPMNILWMLEFQLSAVRYPELRDAYAEQHRRLRDAIRELLVSHLRQTGRDDPEEYGEYADLLMVIVSGLGLMKLVYGDEIEPGLFGRALRAILAGMDRGVVDGGEADATD